MCAREQLCGGYVNGRTKPEEICSRDRLTPPSPVVHPSVVSRPRVVTSLKFGDSLVGGMLWGLLGRFWSVFNLAFLGLRCRKTQPIRRVSRRGIERQNFETKSGRSGRGREGKRACDAAVFVGIVALCHFVLCKSVLSNSRPILQQLAECCRFL